MLINRAANVALRAASLLAKFALIFFLAKWLPPEELGLYGIVTATLSYSMYFLGLDFYTYSTREMLGIPEENWPVLLRDQCVLFSITYVLFLPCLLIVFWFDLIPWKFILITYGLLITEHISQEITRVLVAIQKPLYASLQMFIRGGLWCYLLLVVFITELSPKVLDQVLFFWFVSSFLSVCYGAWVLRKLSWHTIKNQPINWLWIKKGLGVAGRFLVGTLALRGLYTFDRYLVQLFHGQALVGVYTFFIGITMGIQGMIDAAISVFAYPKIVTSFKGGYTDLFKQQVQRFFWQMLLAISICAILAAVLIDPLLQIIDKPLYQQHLAMFWPLLLSVVIFSVSMASHYGLYAMGKDKIMIFANIIALLLFFISAFLLQFFFAYLAIPYALLLATIFVWFFKSYYYRKILLTI